MPYTPGMIFIENLYKDEIITKTEFVQMKKDEKAGCREKLGLPNLDLIIKPGKIIEKI